MTVMASCWKVTAVLVVSSDRAFDSVTCELIARDRVCLDCTLTFWIRCLYIPVKLRDITSAVYT